MHVRQRKNARLLCVLDHYQSRLESRSQTCNTVKQSPHPFKLRTRLFIFLVCTCTFSVSNSAIGDDFYVRGGIARESFEDTVFMDTYCPSGTPAALYGCGTGSDNLPYSSKGSFDPFQSFEIGLGMSTLSNIRVEFLVAYQSSAVFNGNTNFLASELQQSVTAELSTASTSFVVYRDFPKLNVTGTRKTVPYIGAGFGIANHRIETTTMTFPVTMTTVPGASETSLTWSVSFGASTDLSQRVKLDYGVRFVDRSRLRTGLGEGVVSWTNGARGPLSLNLARTEAELRGYSLRISLRYALK